MASEPNDHLDVISEELRKWIVKVGQEKESLIAKFLWRSGAKISDICLVTRETENGPLFYPELKINVFPDERIALEKSLERITQMEVIGARKHKFNTGKFIALESRIANLRQALGYYGDEKNWKGHFVEINDGVVHYPGIIMTDGGSTAREAIAADDKARGE